jgi:hypothetical protein
VKYTLRYFHWAIGNKGNIAEDWIAVESVVSWNWLEEIKRI